MIASDWDASPVSMVLLSYGVLSLWLLLLGAQGCCEESKVGGEGWELGCIVS